MYGEYMDEALEEQAREITKFTIPELKELEANLLEKIKLLEGE